MAEAGQYTFSLHNNNTIETNAPAASQPKNSLSNFSLFKAFTKTKDARETDAQPPKRRGPKPNAKPALTRRQELNRLAQRSHRERRESYVKNLEQQVLALKDAYSVADQERQALARENRKMRDLLEQLGVSPHLSDTTLTASLTGDNSTASVTGSVGPHTNPSEHVHSPFRQASLPAMSPGGLSPTGDSSALLDYEQAGIDFVLTLERPCMDHTQMLCVKSQVTEDISGHVLMASCPPHSHLTDQPDMPYPHQMHPGMSNMDLMRLLDLSKHLPLAGEITPVMAWALLTKHNRFLELSLEDLELIKADLAPRIRCYGFGAVLEDFEVNDAVAIIFESRMKLT